MTYYLSAINYVNNKNNDKDYPLIRVSQSEYNLIRQYLNTVPIIIHIKLDYQLISSFIRDSHYKNTFEIYNTDNQERKLWEYNLFGNTYNNCKPIDRVKYGTLNITKDPYGIKSCIGYGFSYLVLKSTVKNRCTYTLSDSCTNYNPHMLSNIDPIICNINDRLLNDIIQLSCNKSKWLRSNNCNPYIEVQIHGLIRFDRDIEYLIVDNKITNHLIVNKLNEFSNKYNVPWLYIKDYIKIVN
jgi:hypothetical protein